MKVFSLSERIERSGEVALGPDETGTLTTYLIYGMLSPGETGRRLRPGKGREEILFVIDGQVRVEGAGRRDVTCEGGSAVALPEGSDLWVSNLTSKPVQYVIAGGFTEPVHFLNKVQAEASRKATRQQRD